MKKFWLGFVSAQLLSKAAWALALSDSETGADVRKKVIAKFDHDKLIRLSDAIDVEISRRKNP